MQFYYDNVYSDPDPMLDIEAVEQEQQVAFDLHNGYLCTVELS
jgi:hypothetical protein